MAAIFYSLLAYRLTEKKTVFKLEREFDGDMKFEKNPIKNDSVTVTMATDRQMDGQAQNNRDNVLFASLLIGLSVDFL